MATPATGAGEPTRPAPSLLSPGLPTRPPGVFKLSKPGKKRKTPPAGTPVQQNPQKPF